MSILRRCIIITVYFFISYSLIACVADSGSNATKSLEITIVGAGAIDTDGGPRCAASCKQNITHEMSSLKLTAIPDDGSVFKEWRGACSGVSTTCELSAEVDIKVEAIFEEKPSVLTLNKLVVYNTETNKPIAELQELFDGAIINLDELGQNLTLVAEASDDVGSVVFSVDGEPVITESSVPFALASDNAGDLNTWDLSRGNYTVSAQTYSEDGGRGEAGESLTFTISLVSLEWALDQNELLFNAEVGSQAETHSLVLSNRGNIEGEFSFSEIPDWLSIMPEAGTLQAGESITLNLSTEKCSETIRQTHTLTPSNRSQIKVETALVRNCISQAKGDIDFAIDRFYINQSVPALDSKQDLNDQVELVLNRPGMARAFVSIDKNDQQVEIPEVRIYWQDGDGSSGFVSLEKAKENKMQLNEGILNDTHNYLLPRSFFKAGRRFYVEVDPENRIAESNEDNNIYPPLNSSKADKEGFLRYSIRDVPVLKLTIIPLVIKGEAPNLTQERLDGLLDYTFVRHPLNQLDVEVREPFTYVRNKNAKGDAWDDIMDQMELIAKEGDRSRHYAALLDQAPDKGSTIGIANTPGRVLASRIIKTSFSHELGHNFGLDHSPCGKPSGIDKNYPYAKAAIGIWGYDVIAERLRNKDLPDFMSYCDPEWVSDYTFKKTLRRRGGKLLNDNSRRLQKSSPIKLAKNQNVIIVSGQVENEILSLTRITNTRAALENTPGSTYLLEGKDKSGNTIFSIPFDTINLDHSRIDQFSIVAPLPQGVVLKRLLISKAGKVLLEKKSPDMAVMLRKPEAGEINATRLNLSTVELKITKPHETAIVRNSDTEAIIAILDSDTTTVNLYTEANNLTVEIVNGFSAFKHDVAIE